MNISFRPIVDEDIPFLKKLYRSTREEELSTTGWTEEEKSKFIDLQFNAQHTNFSNEYKGANFQIIKYNGEAIGRLYTWEAEDQIRIIDIALLPEFTGKGIGTKILIDLIKHSKNVSKKLSIHVEHNNPALRLYERLGFSKSGDTGFYFFMERIPHKKL